MRLWTRTGPLAAAGLIALTGAADAAPPPTDAAPAIHLPLEEDVNAAALTQAPGNNDLYREYPQVALRMGIGGFSSMTCKTLATGRLDELPKLEKTLRTPSSKPPRRAATALRKPPSPSWTPIGRD